MIIPEFVNSKDLDKLAHNELFRLILYHLLSKYNITWTNRCCNFADVFFFCLLRAALQQEKICFPS